MTSAQTARQTGKEKREMSCLKIKQTRSTWGGMLRFTHVPPLLERVERHPANPHESSVFSFHPPWNDLERPRSTVPGYLYLERGGTRNGAIVDNFAQKDQKA